MSNPKRSTGVSGILSIIVSSLLIGFTFIPLYVEYPIIGNFSVWDFLCHLIQKEPASSWVSILYFAFLSLLLVNIILQIIRCYRAMSIILTLFGVLFIALHITEFSEHWEMTGIGFYVMATLVIIMLVASILPGGKRKDLYEEIVKDYIEERKVARKNTADEVKELKARINTLEREKEKNELEMLRAKVKKLEEEKKRAIDEKEKFFREEKQASSCEGEKDSKKIEPAKEEKRPVKELQERHQEPEQPLRGQVVQEQEEQHTRYVQTEQPIRKQDALEQKEQHTRYVQTEQHVEDMEEEPTCYIQAEQPVQEQPIEEPKEQLMEEKPVQPVQGQPIEEPKEQPMEEKPVQHVQEQPIEEPKEQLMEEKPVQREIDQPWEGQRIEKPTKKKSNNEPLLIDEEDIQIIG